MLVLGSLLIYSVFSQCKSMGKSMLGQNYVTEAVVTSFGHYGHSHKSPSMATVLPYLEVKLA